MQDKVYRTKIRDIEELFMPGRNRSCLGGVWTAGHRCCHWPMAYTPSSLCWSRKRTFWIQIV